MADTLAQQHPRQPIDEGTEEFLEQAARSKFDFHQVSVKAAGDERLKTAINNAVLRQYTGRQLRLLDLPDSDEKTLDEALLVLRDFASGLSLTKEEIEKEKGVIDGEERERDSAGYRMFVRQLTTLFGDTRKGRRPSFIGAAPPELADRLVDVFADAVAARGIPIARGVFGAEMEVELVNDGPMTIWLDTES